MMDFVVLKMMDLARYLRSYATRAGAARRCDFLLFSYCFATALRLLIWVYIWAQEVPGEDPCLTGEYGSYIIAATQQPGDDPRYLAAASTMKHFSMCTYSTLAIHVMIIYDYYISLYIIAYIIACGSKNVSDRQFA